MSSEDEWLSETASNKSNKSVPDEPMSEKSVSDEPMSEKSVPDESMSDTKPVSDQQDFGFLLFLAFIFEKRSKNSTKPDNDKTMGELVTWLKENKKINIDVEPCNPVILNTGDPDNSVIIDALNTYSPDFPISMILKDPSDTYILKKLEISSPSTYSYESNGVIDIPFLHGGIINISGDVNFDSIVDLINSQSLLAFTSEINVSGKLVGCDNDTINLAVKYLRDGIYNTSDENIHGFSVKGVCENPLFVKPVYVRNWVITFKQSEVSTLELSSL